MQDLRIAAMENGGLLDAAVDRALEALARDEPVAPSVLRLALRRYAMTGRDDLEVALGPALARALDASGADEAGRSDWLLLFVDAGTLSHDERLRDAARALEAGIRRGWPSIERAGQKGFVASVMRSIDACLRAADLHADDARRRLAIVDAVDELERVVGPRYRPGAGLAEWDGTRGDLRNHVRTASALLTAHDRTGRLPYSMLAEELMQFARRTCWPSMSPSLCGPPSGGPARLEPDPTAVDVATDFVAASETVSVLCRVAALHRDPDYREAAVIAPETDYAAEAERLLRLLADRSDAQDVAAAAEYGLALCDWLMV